MLFKDSFSIFASAWLNKMFQTNTNIELDLYFTIIYLSATFWWNAFLQTIWTKTNILTQQQKLSRTAITQPNFGKWSPISNIIYYIIYFIIIIIYYILQLYKPADFEWNQCIPSKVTERKWKLWWQGHWRQCQWRHHQQQHGWIPDPYVCVAMQATQKECKINFSIIVLVYTIYFSSL